MTNDWLVILKLKNMPNDADEDSIKMFIGILAESNYDDDAFADIEIAKIERVPE